MLKKILLGTLTAATVILPTTGAFAADDVTILNPNGNSLNTPPVIVGGPVHKDNSGSISILTTTFKVKTATNVRKTPSSSGTYVGSVYPGELLSSNFTIVNKDWVQVWSNTRPEIKGYIQLSSVEEYG